ncbi:hypothetical protein [Pseudomonas sp. AM14(2022)]|uniref:hypothetical protein n=1 Tax=Pseudomonas sp. AM14(2022) TaxID=2983371 RepID=UPI002E805D8B|nr:hypothetical protein [Pseudomonas sp. AM14(2022)]
MNKSINTKEQLDALLQEVGRVSDGVFNASVGKRPFVSATKGNAVLYVARNDFFIIGVDDNERGHVAFCVPRSLVGDGPHDVECYKGDLSWTADDNGNYQLIKSGRARVTFLRREGFPYAVSGDIDFDFSDEGKITGKFEIKLRE